MSRGAGVALATFVVVLALAGPASAVTPQQISQKIFADLADNGRLDGHYTRVQINRALHAPSLQGYEQPSRQPTAVVPKATSVTDTGGSLPFSGLDLALFGGVGAPLLLLGASLGRVARARPHGELS